MQTPAVAFIEEAIERLKSVPESRRKSQIHELHSLGEPALQSVGQTYPVTQDFEKGYELGLQTMREMILHSLATPDAIPTL